MLLAQGLSDFIARIVLIRAFILAQQIAVPAVFLHDPDDPLVRNRRLHKVVAHVDELGMAAVYIREQGNDVFRFIGRIVGIPVIIRSKLGAEYAEVYIKAEVLRPGLLNKCHKVVDHIALEIGRRMDFRAHLNAELLRQWKGALDDLPPVQHGLQLVRDDRHLGAHNRKPESVGKAYIALQHGYGFLCRQITEPQHMGINPVAVFHGNDLILVAETEPFLHPFIRRIRIIFNMGIGQDFNAVSAHIVDVFKTILQSFRETEVSRITVERDTPLRPLPVVSVHTPFLLFSLRSSTVLRRAAAVPHNCSQESVCSHYSCSRNSLQTIKIFKPVCSSLCAYCTSGPGIRHSLFARFSMNSFIFRRKMKGSCNNLCIIVAPALSYNTIIANGKINSTLSLTI